MLNIPPDYPMDKAIPLPATGIWPGSVHRFDAAAIAALRAAEAAGRPLLVRGEPGTGKSQTARAAAAATGRLFLSVVIDGRTEAQDLLWRYDAVARLADAQLGRDCVKDATHYLSPGPLWWAYHWEDAEKHWNTLRQGEIPAKPDGWQAAQGAVLLLDEIDKADPDLPNAFLDLLANQGFTVPFLGHKVVKGGKPPLVVITTNEERELPRAFLRRCLVLKLSFPGNLVPWLVDMGQMHLENRPDLAGRCFSKALELAAEQVVADRAQALEAQIYAPGLAEYLDLVIALATLGDTQEAQIKLLADLAVFVLRKSPDDPGLGR